jgi:hypothetical protein
VSAVEGAIAWAMQVLEARSAAVVDVVTGTTLAVAGEPPLGPDELAAAAAMVLAGQRITLRLDPSPTEDLLVCTAEHFHLIRPVHGERDVVAFVHVLLDRDRTNLALARRDLARLGAAELAAEVSAGHRAAASARSRREAAAPAEREPPTATWLVAEPDPDPDPDPDPAPEPEPEPVGPAAGWPEPEPELEPEPVGPAAGWPEPGRAPPPGDPAGSRPGAGRAPPPGGPAGSRPGPGREPPPGDPAGGLTEPGPGPEAGPVRGWTEPRDRPGPPEELPRRTPNTTWPGGRPVDADVRLEGAGAAVLDEIVREPAAPVDDAVMHRLASGLRRL